LHFKLPRISFAETGQKKLSFQFLNELFNTTCDRLLVSADSNFPRKKSFVAFPPKFSRQKFPEKLSFQEN
jgi:hypothetical protein